MLSSIIFSNNLFFLCLLVGLLSTIALYYSQRNLLKSPTLYFLSLIRFVSITFLCFLLLDPVVKSINKLKEEPIVVILQDESSSIKEDLRDELIQFSNNIKGYDIYSYNLLQLRRPNSDGRVKRVVHGLANLILRHNRQALKKPLKLIFFS